MNELIKVLLIIGGYLLIGLVVYLILYCTACKDYKKSSYIDFETYIERKEGGLGLVGILWPVFMVVGIVAVSIDFVKSIIRKHYGI